MTDEERTTAARAPDDGGVDAQLDVLLRWHAAVTSAVGSG